MEKIRLSVSQNEHSEFHTIMQALEAAKSHTDKEIVIEIGRGTYKEKIEVHQDHVTFLAKELGEVVLTYDDYAMDYMSDGSRRGTFRSYSVFIDANDFTAKNIIFQNNSGRGDDVGQALSLYVDGDRIFFDHCKMWASQDTIFTGPLPETAIQKNGFVGPKEFADRIVGRQCFYQCFIGGDVDFIFGSGKAYFEECELYSRNRDNQVNGYVTAASTQKDETYGYIFNHCKFTSNCPKETVYLGRPWRDYAKVVIMNSEIGPHIHRNGWHDWNKETAREHAFFAEYNNYGEGAATSERVSFAKQLKKEEAKEYTIENIFQDWNPLTIEQLNADAIDSNKMWIADQGDGTYTNPILYTDYSDPDVIRVGEDYFMVASSFCNTPAIPVLHSKDLVNWKVISYVLEKIPFQDYDTPQHGRGVWAPAIRFHDGKFYVFYPMPDEGIFQCTTTNPWEGWSKPVCVRNVVGWIDPCPFWDEDGKAYFVSAFARSRIGFKSILHLSSMEPDATGVLDDGKHIFDGNETQPTIEGPKLYKRNGYYYVFAPAGGVKPGWQVVLRSKNIWGPYEEKIVMHQGNTPVNGPHQGGWIDTPNGENWFIHFQDVGNAGRIIHLQPMKWVDDWPVIGINEDENGCGEPVLRYKKPEVGNRYKIDAPEDSDFFTGSKLGLQWQWNANYDKSWYEIDVAHSQLRLYAVQTESNLNDVSNLLLQKWPAPKFNITAKLSLEHLEEKDIAGLVSLGGIYTGLGIYKTGGKKYFVQSTGEWEKDNEVTKVYDEIKSNQVLLRINVNEREEISFYYSLNTKDSILEESREAGPENTPIETRWIPIGDTITATPGRWVGVKVGLYCINREKITNGFCQIDYFVYTE